ncbi:carbonic anhydrase [Brevundimonas sp.]|uniref:carbonic anhydrase n=1 Tax=Brevundimonas sp. TaxID=1871086 RepID=UPI0025D109AF|nr:carbonic anhydrase [Brevundimonas sp.]
MDTLIEGYRRFRADGWSAHRDRLKTLADEGQRPTAMIIACSDSRADPAMVFDTAPGELFVVRNVANLVPPYQPDGGYHGVSAALEFGVKVLQVPNLIVMGHAHCGGVNAMIHGAPDIVKDFVAPWVAMARPALDAARASGVADEDLQAACEHETVKVSLANLRTFPWIAEREADGRLRLHGLRFAIADGVLERLGDDGAFSAV